MISRPDYVAILANVNKNSPVDLDRVLFGTKELAGSVVMDTTPAHQVTRLWPLADPSVSFIGCRVTEPIEKPQYVAARLAAVALERQIHPIFLSYVADCAMQRFGFRVEQLSGLDANSQKVCEAQLTQFWNFAWVFEATEIERLR